MNCRCLACLPGYHGEAVLTTAPACALTLLPYSSQPAPKVPTRDAFKIYDIKQYARDTRGGHPTAATHTMLDEVKANPRQAGNVLQPVLPDTLGNPSPGRVVCVLGASISKRA